MHTTKKCNECKQVLDASEFYVITKVGRIGLSACCKPCHKKRNLVIRDRIAAKQKVIPEVSRCTKCGDVKDTTCFNRDNNKINGLTSWCKDCIRVHRETVIVARRAHDREYYASHRDRWVVYQTNHAAHIKTTQRTQKSKNRRRYWTHNTIKSHAQRGFKIVITTDDLHKLALDTDNCPMCGVSLKWETGKLCDASPTLDRINNGDEIRLDNVWILCHRCNGVKRDLPMWKFVDFCDMVSKKFKKVP
jgi:hypothetical protein